MEVRRAHCLFEQSGTFKREFEKLGIPAEDYDIQDNFGETNHVCDLFAEIENAWGGQPSIFDKVAKEDIVMAFFPCIYFCETSQCAFRIWHFNYRKLPDKEKIEKVISREENRTYFYTLLLKLTGICLTRQLRLIIENPWSGIGYLRNNFLKDPDIIDMDRTRRGDFYVKPTAFWFFGCEPTRGETLQQTPIDKIKTIRTSKSAPTKGLCSEDRSMISPDYARNFICDFILGRNQPEICPQLFPLDN